MRIRWRRRLYRICIGIRDVTFCGRKGLSSNRQRWRRRRRRGRGDDAATLIRGNDNQHDECNCISWSRHDISTFLKYEKECLFCAMNGMREKIKYRLDGHDSSVEKVSKWLQAAMLLGFAWSIVTNHCNCIRFSPEWNICHLRMISCWCEMRETLKNIAVGILAEWSLKWTQMEPNSLRKYRYRRFISCCVFVWNRCFFVFWEVFDRWGFSRSWSSSIIVHGDRASCVVCVAETFWSKTTTTTPTSSSRKI